MRPSGIKSVKFQDSLAAKRRKRFLARSVGGLIILVILTGAAIYFSFFAGAFDVRTAQVKGLKASHQDQVQSSVATFISQKYFGISPKLNHFFLSKSRIKRQLLDQFLFLDDLLVSASGSHGLVFDFKEREPKGVWCFEDDCYFFDKDGLLIEKTFNSSGYLLLTVSDQRLREEKSGSIDKPYFEAVMAAKEFLDSRGIKIRQITVKKDKINDFEAETSAGYSIKFSVSPDLKNQLEVLKIFLDQKRNDSNFHPQYIDARIDSRVYYK